VSRIRITIDALEHMLDLPEGVAIIGALSRVHEVDGVRCMTFDIEVADHDAGGMTNDADVLYALQYEEDEDGQVALVSAIPVPQGSGSESALTS